MRLVAVERGIRRHKDSRTFNFSATATTVIASACGPLDFIVRNRDIGKFCTTRQAKPATSRRFIGAIQVTSNVSFDFSSSHDHAIIACVCVEASAIELRAIVRDIGIVQNHRRSIPSIETATIAKRGIPVDDSVIDPNFTSASPTGNPKATSTAFSGSRRIQHVLRDANITGRGSSEIDDPVSDVETATSPHRRITINLHDRRSHDHIPSRSSEIVDLPGQHLRIAT